MKGVHYDIKESAVIRRIVLSACGGNGIKSNVLADLWLGVDLDRCLGSIVQPTQWGH